MASKYSEWKVGELVAELKRRGKGSSGRKKDLIVRLDSLDRMGISEAMGEKAREFWMDVPEPKQYSDIHGGSKIQNVNMTRIQDYMRSNDKEFETKCRDMYRERYIRFIRHAPGGYFRGEVWSEYPKSTFYCVDVRLDNWGVIQEAQCTCTAGEGPGGHCKHIATLLYGIMTFSTSGNLLTELTCTQKLQTFHRAKPFKGSPMKSKDLAEIRNKDFEYDPRPPKFRKREGYADEFRNKVLSFMDETKMPVHQLYGPANPVVTNFMHDYDGRADDKFFIDHKLTKITSDQCKEIEERTRGQTHNQEWFRERRLRLTASNFGRVCKAKNFAAVAKSLLCHKEFFSKPTAHGQKYESVAVERFQLATKLDTTECGLFISEDHPWLAASPDRALKDNVILEVKCPYSAKDKPITSSTVPYLLHGASGLELRKDHDYYYQVQGQLLCSNCDFSYFVVMTLVDFVIIKISKDEEFISSMVDKLNHFYHTYFKDAIIQKYVFRQFSNYFD